MLSTKKKVCVLMPTFNAAKFISYSIKSILDQSFRDFDFFIIDDCSIDDSRRIISEFEKKDSRIKYFRNNNNIGYSSILENFKFYSNYDYLVRMDADDISHKDRISTQLKIIEQNDNIGVIGTNAIYINKNNDEISKNYNFKSGELLNSDFKNFNRIFHSSTIINIKKLIDVGGYRKVFEPSEDLDLWLRISKKYKIVNLNKYLLQYRLHENNFSENSLEKLAKSHLNALYFNIREDLHSKKINFSDDKYFKKNVDRFLYFTLMGMIKKKKYEYVTNYLNKNELISKEFIKIIFSLNNNFLKLLNLINIFKLIININETIKFFIFYTIKKINLKIFKITKN